MNARLLLVPLFLFAASALAADPPKVDPKADSKAEDDPIAAQLLKDKEAYSATLEKAREDMLKAFDKHYESVKSNKSLKLEVQLAQLEKVEAEKKAFEENGVPPGLPGLKVAMSEYRTNLKKAETVCKAAFDKAGKAYRDKGDLKAAGAIVEEMKEFLAKTPGAGGAAGAGVTLIVTHSGWTLGLSGGATEDGTKVVTVNYIKGDQTQLWKLVPAGDGWVHIENVKSGLVFAVNGKGNGAELHVAKKQANADGQLWKPTPVANQKDVFKFVNKGSNKVVGVDGKSQNAGVRILLWDDVNESPEWFKMPPPK
jgi:hypothetical protein